MMALVFVFQAVTFTIHKCSKSKEEERPPAEIKTEEAHATLFAFNPNTITIDSLQLLGLTQKQALTIIHYREKGGRFRKKEDFSKMYTVSPEKYRELEPYIIIPTSEKRPAPKPVIIERPKEKPEVKPEVKPVEKPEMPKEENIWKAPKEKVYVDLNEADSAALISVKGIGPYFCKAILSYRKALGSFASIDQLLEIRGMNQEKFDRIKDQVFVHPGGIKKFSIAEADENFLRRHPYIGAYNARGIALFIQSQGKEKCTLKSLCENNILSAQDTLRLHPYME